MNFRLLSIFLVFFLISCEDNNDSSSIDIKEVKSIILKNETKWILSSLTDYSFTYQKSPGDCPTADELPSVDINVEDGVVVSVFYSGTSEVAHIDNATTINDVFSHLLHLAAENPIQFSSSKNEDKLPHFDENLGYPISFYVDKSKKECDAISIRLSNFK